MSKPTWREITKTGRLSANIEDRRGFNGMGNDTLDRVLFDKTPSHTWGKEDPESDRQATMKRIEDRVREYNKTIPPMEKSKD